MQECPLPEIPAKGEFNLGLFAFLAIRIIEVRQEPAVSFAYKPLCGEHDKAFRFGVGIL